MPMVKEFLQIDCTELSSCCINYCYQLIGDWITACRQRRIKNVLPTRTVAATCSCGMRLILADGYWRKQKPSTTLSIKWEPTNKPFTVTEGN